MAKDSNAPGTGQVSHPDRADAIRAAALRRFAEDGVRCSTLRRIADDAGVSVGLVQHHFGTKERLVEAVDAYAVGVAERALGAGPRDRDDVVEESDDVVEESDDVVEESVEGAARRVRALVSSDPDVVDYLSRAMADHTALGTKAFDALVAGIQRQGWLRQVGEDSSQPVRGDACWAVLNPLLLTLGTVILRRHVDRLLPEPFMHVDQQARWESAVIGLLRHGQMR